jgi:N-acetylmuramoyl-L-alanine amidase
MRSFGNYRVRVTVAAIAAWLAVCAAAGAQTVKERFEAAQQRDEKVRLLLTNFTDKTPPRDLAMQVSQVMTSFEALVRRFPTSAYADDALWQAASLAEAAYQRLNRNEDRDKALKLYRWLLAEYPNSAFIKSANRKIANLRGSSAPPPAVASAPARSLPAPAAAIPPPAAPVTPAPVLNARSTAASAMANVPAAVAAESPVVAPPVERATLNAIQRTVLPDSVRVTLELDREVAYREERLAGPSRVFFDLKNVQLTPALMDKVLTYSSDVVSKIRVGRHPDNTVRVVLDLEEVSKYSVFTLYSPFRLVIDAERTVARTVATPTTVAPATVEHAPLASARPESGELRSDRAVATSGRESGPAQPVELRETPIAAPTPEVPPPPPPAPLPSGPPPGAPAANVAGGFSMARQLGLSVSRIVIDPGHGGHDPGTIAKGLTEASLTLEVALRLEKLLKKEPGVEVVLTRRTDVYIPLEERTAIANRENADLFLSIHANSSRNTTAKGVETYFLSFASSPEAEAIAARENSTSGREMHQLPDLIKAISLNNKLDESRDLAGMVQESLVSTLRKSNKDVRSRGVKKAPFVVLIGAEMPSVLAEMSFLTNRQELQLLKSSAYKERIAQALHSAVMRYRRSLKGTTVATIER